MMSPRGWLIATGTMLAALLPAQSAEASPSFSESSSPPAWIQTQSQQTKPRQTEPPPPPENKKEKEKEEKESEDRDLNVDPAQEMMARAAIELRKREHQQAVDASEQILKRASQLEEGLASGRLPKNSNGLLNEIEKSAKRIRSVAGVGSPETTESLPEVLTEAVEQLKETAERLNQEMKKLSAYAVSVTVMNDSERILQLSRLIRQKLRGS